MATISRSVRLSPPLEGAISGLGANRAALLLAFILVGVAELGDASGVELSTMQADLHHVLRYHLPEPLRLRLEALQNAMRSEQPGGEAAPRPSWSRQIAAAPPVSTAELDGAYTLEKPEEQEEPAAEEHPLAGEGDDY